MQGFAHRRFDCFTECVTQYLRLYVGVNFVHIAHAAAQHNAIGVKQVDDLRQGSAQSVQVELKTLPRIPISATHGMNDLQN